MVLERINSVIIENFRSFSGLQEPFIFKDGLNLISGDNGSGKTTIRLAIVLGLFSRTSGKGLESVLRGKTPARISIDFEANGQIYKIEKTFALSGGGDAKLTCIGTDNVYELEEAVVECRKLVSGTNESEVNIISGKLGVLHDTISPAQKFSEGELSKLLGNNMGSLLFPEQGKLVDAFKSNNVLKNIGLDDTFHLKNSELKKLENRVDEERMERLQKGKNTFKIDLEKEIGTSLKSEGLLDKKFKKTLEIIENVNKGEAMELKLREYYTSLETLYSEDQQINEGEDLNAKAEELENSAELHRVKREEESKQTESKENTVENLEKLLKTRNELKNKINIVQNKLNIEKSKLTQEENSLNRNTKDYERIQIKIESNEKEYDIIEKWIEYDGSEGVRKQFKNQIDVLNKKIKNIDIKKGQIEDIRKKRQKIVPATTDQWDKITDLEQTIKFAQNALSPWKFEITALPKGFVVNIDDKNNTDNEGDVHASLSMSNSNGEKIISIKNPEKNRSVDELEYELKSCYELLGVVSKGELNIRKEKYDTYTNNIEFIEKTLIESDTKSDIKDEIKKITETLKIQKNKPDSEKPDGMPMSWENKKLSIGAVLEASKKIRKELNDSKIRLEESIKSIVITINNMEEDIKDTNETVSAHEKEYNSDSEINEKLAYARKEYEKYKKISDLLNASKDVEEVGARNQAGNLRKNITKQNEISTHIASNEAFIEAIIQNSDYSRLVDFKDQLEVAKEDLNAELIETKAILLLLNIIKTLSEDKMASIYPILQQIMDNIADSLYGSGAKVTLNENGFPKSLQRYGRDNIQFAWESYGTREQLNLIYRLAMLRIVSDEEDTRICFALDDPFVNTDKIRRGKLLNHLTGLVSRGNHQALIFTCHQEQFGLGHIDHHIEM